MYFFQVSKSFAKRKPWIAVSSFKARMGPSQSSLSLWEASLEGEVPAASQAADLGEGSLLHF